MPPHCILRASQSSSVFFLSLDVHPCPLACHVLELLYGSFNTSHRALVNFQCVPILLCIFIAFEIAIPLSTTSHHIPCFTSLTLFAVRYFPEEREHVQVW